MMNKVPRVAIVHDFLQSLGGAERVTLAISDIYPNAPIYTLTYDKKLDPWFGNRKIITSYLQWWSWLPAKFLLPFYAQAIESFNFDDFDIVISSSHSFAKNILTSPATTHISYIHSPMRYVWDAWHSYLAGQRASGLVKGVAINILHHLRIWDRLGVSRVDYFIANSKYVGQRIRKFYRRESQVIYPPVDTDKIQPSRDNEGYFIVISRLSQYKRVDLALQACQELGLPLVIIGTGEMERELRRQKAPTTSMLGWVDDEKKIQYLQRARALIFPGEEDFGIVPVEAQAAGKPVIAYRQGGVLETVVDEKTGFFFDEQTVDSLKKTLRLFLAKERDFNPDVITTHALAFSRQRFQAEIKQLVDKLLSIPSVIPAPPARPKPLA